MKLIRPWCFTKTVFDYVPFLKVKLRWKMIELFVFKFQSFYSSSFLKKMLVSILFHSASFFIPLIFANFVNCLYFMFCFLQALYHCLGLKSFISVRKACIKRIFFSNLCFRYAIIRFEEYFARKNEFLSLQWKCLLML